MQTVPNTPMSPTNGPIVRALVMRKSQNKKTQIGDIYLEAHHGNVAFPAGALQAIDEQPPVGPCEYFLELERVQNGILTFSPNVRLAVWEIE